MNRSILDKWKITELELTKLVNENPSLRGFIFGYISEYKMRNLFIDREDITGIKKYDDHDRKKKGDLSFIYKSTEIKMESKSLQTNSVVQTSDNTWSGKFQCDASDRRKIILPNGSEVETTCLAVGEFDILAVSLFAFEDTWKFAFAKNSDLPHPTSRSRNVAPEDREYLIKTLIDISWPLQPPFTEDIYSLLDEIVASKS